MTKFLIVLAAVASGVAWLSVIVSSLESTPCMNIALFLNRLTRVKLSLGREEPLSLVQHSRCLRMFKLFTLSVSFDWLSLLSNILNEFKSLSPLSLSLPAKTFHILLTASFQYRIWLITMTQAQAFSFSLSPRESGRNVEMRKKVKIAGGWGGECAVCVETFVEICGIQYFNDIASEREIPF
jgi:hypothetical protein